MIKVINTIGNVNPKNRPDKIKHYIIVLFLIVPRFYFSDNNGNHAINNTGDVIDIVYRERR